MLTEDAALVVTVRSDVEGVSVEKSGRVRVKHDSSSTIPPPCCKKCNRNKH